MIRAIYSDTWDGLTVKILGYNHDHCHIVYLGLTNELPSEYEKYKNLSKFVFLYEEDKPINK